MKQMLIAGKYNLLHSTITEYNSLTASRTWQGNPWEYQAERLISTAGTIKNLRVKLNDSPGAGKSYTFTLMLNDNPTSLALTISNAETSGADATSVAVVAGDVVNLRCIPSGTPTARYATWTSIFEGSTVNESLIMGGTGGNPLNSADIHYANLMSIRNSTSIAEDDYRTVCPASGTIKNLYIKLNVDPGTSPDAYRFTLRKGGISQSLTVTITADNTTGNDTANSFSVAPGDILTLMIEPLNSPSELPRPTWGMTFVADTDGESIILGGSANSLHATDTEFIHLITDTIWTVTELERYQLGQVCVLKKLYILLDGTPGSGNDYTFTIMIGAAGSNVVAVVTGLATTGNSSALEDTVADDEYLALKVVPTSIPTVRDAYWGLISYIAPVVGWSISLSPGLTASSTVAYSAAFDRSMSPGLTAAVTIAAVWGRLITTVANLTVNSVVARFMTYTRATTTNLTASVTILKGWGREIATNTALTISATIVKGWGRAIATNTALAVSATISRTLAYVRATAAGLAASVTIIATFVGAITEYFITVTTNLTASVTVVRVFGKNIATNTALAISVSITLIRISEWIKLTLLSRIFGLTLKPRTLNLTLKPRSLNLTLRKR